MSRFLPTIVRKAIGLRGLFLSRRMGERVVIDHAGERLVITIGDIRRLMNCRPEVRLAFDGPRSFAIGREESQPDNTETNTAAVPRTGHPPAEPAAAVDYQRRHQGLATPALGTRAG